MTPRNPNHRFSRLIGRLVDRNLPSKVHLANETGAAPGSLGVLPFPRFSLCISGAASYQVTRDGRTEVVRVAKGEAIAVAPGCLMEHDRSSRYLALGIVFTPEMTRFLLARKDSSGHRFLLVHHSTALADDEMLQFFRALTRPSARDANDAYLRKLQQLLLIKSREMTESEEPVPASRKAWFTWQSACRFVQENFSQPIGRADVAAFLKLHQNHLSRLFSRFSGHSFNRYLLGIRLDHAVQMLEDPTHNISEIARACGFTDTNYFVRCFRKEMGQSPTRFRAASRR